jgi:tryptophan synthase alpha chain
MNGLEAVTTAFDKAHSEARAALMPYVTLGFPSQETSLEIVQSISEAGADMIELGVPFSDPLADGPTIQHSTQVALQQGTTPKRCLEMVAELRNRGVTLPFFLMGYYNPIITYGITDYVMDTVKDGADGLIIPDLPVEEAGEIESACRARNFALVFLLAPTSTPERAAKVASHTSGFLYLVSLTGVTGARQALNPNLEAFIKRARQAAHTPVAVGFGISTSEQANKVAKVADGVIIGSALVSVIAQSAEPRAAAAKFIREMKAALKQN